MSENGHILKCLLWF